MDPLDDIFGANTSGEGNSTIDDDFEALFGNITVPSSSDIDSICEEDTSSPSAQPSNLTADDNGGPLTDDWSILADVSKTNGEKDASAESSTAATITKCTTTTTTTTTTAAAAAAADTEDTSAQSINFDLLSDFGDTGNNDYSSDGLGGGVTLSATKTSEDSSENVLLDFSDVDRSTGVSGAGEDAQTSPDDLLFGEGGSEKEAMPSEKESTHVTDDLLDIFATPPPPKEETKGTSQTETSDLAAVAVSSTAKSSLFEDDMFDFFSPSNSNGSEQKQSQDANDLLDALPRSADVKQGEATLIATPDDRQSDIQDFLGDFNSLPDIVAMEKVEEPEPAVKDTGKDTESSWIMLSADDDEDMTADDVDSVEKDAEKDEKAETEKTEKEEKEKTTDGSGITEQSDTKKPPAEENFMDFSILELPGYAHLNLDVNKHKRTLSKKGSISRRKRPTRAAIQVGMDSEDSHFQDSTEPKPKAPESSGEETETQRDDEVGKGDNSGESTPPPEKKPSPIKKAGGIKIPGLLQGLSKAKPFAKKSKKNAPEEDKKMAKEPETMEVTPIATSTTDSQSSVPSSFSSSSSSSTSTSNVKSAIPPATSHKPSALARMLPVPPSSKVQKDSQNKNIIEAAASVKPSSMTGGQCSTPGRKLPALKADNSSSSPKPAMSQKNAPPVARKPTVPSKPKPSPAKTSNSVSPTPGIEDSSSLTAKKNGSALVTNAAISPAVKTETPSPSKAKPALQVAPKPRLKPIPNVRKDGDPKTASSSYLLEKSKIGLTSSSAPLPGIDKQSEKHESTEKTSEKKENIPLSPTNSFSGSPFNTENKKQSDTTIGNTNMDDGKKAELMPRKSSMSGISPVLPPGMGEKPAPRKNSITGSAYAPMGFRSTLGSSASSDGEGKTRTSSTSSNDGTRKSYSRQTSETQSIESTENKPINVLHKNNEDTQNTRLNSETVLKEANGTIANDNKKIETPSQKSISNEMGSNDDSSPFGIQLRKTNKKKVPLPKPTESNETESPAVNWRQSLGQRRKSSVPKEPVEKAATETDKPDWMKALSERRKRLRESGIIPADAN